MLSMHAIPAHVTPEHLVAGGRARNAYGGDMSGLWQALDFVRVCTAAILAFLILDVKHPPRELLLRDPRGYLAAVKNQGGIVLLMFLFCVGIPVLAFQYFTRAADGAGLTKCIAYAFHHFRSCAPVTATRSACFLIMRSLILHRLGPKFKSVYISMITLMGLATCHPKLRPLLEQLANVSLLCRIFSAFDRLLEFINAGQQKRCCAFRGFDSQLQFSKYLKPLIHMDAAWREADGTGTGMDDGIPAYLLNDVSELRRRLRAALGTDLATPTIGNPLWHTGNAVPLDGGDYRERTPWVWVWEVAEGNSEGDGRGKRMNWRRFVAIFVSEHWFRS